MATSTRPAWASSAGSTSNPTRSSSAKETRTSTASSSAAGPSAIAAVRSLLEPKEDDKKRDETTEALSWLDAEPGGWKGFMDSVEWSFDAPDLDAVHRRIEKVLAARDDTNSLPAQTFLERLVAHVLRASSQPRPEDRTLTPKAFSDLIEAARTDLGSWAKTPGAERIRTVFDELKQVQHLLHDNTASSRRRHRPASSSPQPTR